MLEIKNLNFSYSKKEPIFASFNAQFLPSQITSITGPSGVGKSTLFSIISGEFIPNQGEIVLNNQSINHIKMNKRPIITMFQGDSLFPHLSVEQNISYGMTSSFNRSRFKNIDLNKKVSSMLELVNLSDFEKRMPASLSGGQKQRVALARSLAVSPKVLLLDEPFSALDKDLRQSLLFLVKDIVIKEAIICLQITHNLSADFSDQEISLSS
jgi:iron(III) transport system ATP-binding protein